MTEAIFCPFCHRLQCGQARCVDGEVGADADGGEPGGGLTITVWPSLFEPRGRRVRTSWAALANRTENPVNYDTNDNLPRWSSATFANNYRLLANVEHVAAVVLDLDQGAPGQQVVDAFGGFMGFLHTTKRSTLEHPRWRLVLPLSRLVVAGEYVRVWRATAVRAEKAGIVPDYQAADASHAWAVPARYAGVTYQYIPLYGVLFDVAAALALIPPSAPLPLDLPSGPLPLGLASRVRRASRYIAAMPPAISGSGGHVACFRVALALVQGFALPHEVALRLLVQEYNPRCQPAWSSHELRHKIASAALRGRRPTGWLGQATGTRRRA